MARHSAACLLIVGLLTGISSATEAERRVDRRALLVGCTDYQLSNLPDLWGPSNDVPAWSRALVRFFGFTESNVRSLVGWPQAPDDRPTRENIVNYIKYLLNTSVENDQVVILLAGHGAQIPAMKFNFRLAELRG